MYHINWSRISSINSIIVEVSSSLNLSTKDTPQHQSILLGRKFQKRGTHLSRHGRLIQGLHNGAKSREKNTTQYKPEMRWYGRVRKDKSCASWGFLTVTSMKSVVFKILSLNGWYLSIMRCLCFFSTLHRETKQKTTQSGLFKDLRSTRGGAAFPAKALKTIKKTLQTGAFKRLSISPQILVRCFYFANKSIFHNF